MTNKEQENSAVRAEIERLGRDLAAMTRRAEEAERALEDENMGAKSEQRALNERIATLEAERERSWVCPCCRDGGSLDMCRQGEQSGKALLDRLRRDRDEARTNCAGLRRANEGLSARIATLEAQVETAREEERAAVVARIRRRADGWRTSILDYACYVLDELDLTADDIERNLKTTKPINEDRHA